MGCLYLLNGNLFGIEKFLYKLDWMECLIVCVRQYLEIEILFVLFGDYNVIFDLVDVKNL